MLIAHPKAVGLCAFIKLLSVLGFVIVEATILALLQSQMVAR